MEVEQSTLGHDSLVHIEVYYTDGDGDIGLDSTDIQPPFHKGGEFWQNLPVRIFHEVNGSFEELLNPQTQLPFDLPVERIPRITPDGKNKTINGTIIVHIPANPLNTQPGLVKYELELIDRQLNRSNKVETPSVQLSH
jgi:hypothetical protein